MIVRWGFAAVAFGAMALAAESPSVTFHKDVLPILQKNCQSCHRPGQIAPMSLLSYAEARPWAKAMKTAVLTRKMPPWFADPHYLPFANDRSLKQSDIETIAKWADTGALEGDAKAAPPPLKWPADGWEIQPDLIVKGPEFTVPARPKNNVIEWSYIIVPSGITSDTWVTSMEIRPSEPAVTHHICVYFKPHTACTFHSEFPRRATPRALPSRLTTPIGKAPRPSLRSTRMPTWMFPHMHVRGKDMTYRLVYPDGRAETVLNVPRYDFNWQLGYDLASPIHVTKGTKLEVTAQFDNSVGNKFNPDPNRTVYYGDMTWEEMMFPFFSLVVDKRVDPKKVVRGRRADGA